MSIMPSTSPPAAISQLCEVGPRATEFVRILHREVPDNADGSRSVALVLGVRPPDENIAMKLVFIGVTNAGSVLVSTIERMPAADLLGANGSRPEAAWRIAFDRLPREASSVQVTYYWQLSGTVGGASSRACYVTAGPARLGTIRLSDR